MLTKEEKLELVKLYDAESDDVAVQAYYDLCSGHGLDPRTDNNCNFDANGDPLPIVVEGDGIVTFKEEENKE